MNFIQFTDFNQITGKDKNFYLVKDWRKVDFEKIDMFFHMIFDKITQLSPDYQYKIDKEDLISPYLCDYASFYENYKIFQQYKTFDKEFEVVIPKLMYKNYFILNKTLYIPLMFLEKSPIDKVVNQKGYKIYANLNPEYNFTFDFSNEKVFFKFKDLPFEIFFKIIYKNDQDKLNELLKLGFIKNDKVTKSDSESFIKFLGFHKKDYFDEIDIVDFIDEFLFLPYFKEIFNDYYGVNNIKDVIWKIIDIFVNEIEIDMADLSNRRVVLSEYLLKPIFELYLRLLYGVVDKKSNNFLPTTNPQVIMSTGFRGLMHGGNLYDISLPYPSPLIYKISQDITIIDEGRLPKSWVRNDASAYSLVCPVSVSAQKTAANLIFTTNTLINKYGRIKLKGI